MNCNKFYYFIYKKNIRESISSYIFYGMKPTYRWVSRYGLVAFASSLNQIGPFENIIDDLSLLLEVIPVYDDKDCISSNVENVFL